MPVVTRSTLDGTTYRLDTRHPVAMEDRSLPVGLWSASGLVVDGVLLLFRASDSYTCRSILQADYNVDFFGEYSIRSGRLVLGSYQVDDGDLGDTLPPLRHVCLWETEGLAIFGETDKRSPEWIAEVLASASPEIVNQSPVLTGFGSGWIDATSSSMVLTLFGLGVAELEPIAHSVAPTAAGLPAVAGQVFREISVEGEISVILMSPSAVLQLGLLQISPDAAASFVADDVLELSLSTVSEQ